MLLSQCLNINVQVTDFRMCLYPTVREDSWLTKLSNVNENQRDLCFVTANYLTQNLTTWSRQAVHFRSRSE